MGILLALDERLSYVRFLAEDGALLMAARTLDEVADELRKASDDRAAELLADRRLILPAVETAAKQHDDPHDAIDAGHPCHGDQLEADACSGDPVNLLGSGPVPIEPRGAYSPWGDQQLPSREG